MKGIVTYISPNQVRVVAQTEYGYTVFDTDDGEFKAGDLIIGDLDDHGEQVVTNLRTRQKACVYIEAVQASAKSAASLVRRTSRR